MAVANLRQSSSWTLSMLRTAVWMCPKGGHCRTGGCCCALATLCSDAHW